MGMLDTGMADKIWGIGVVDENAGWGMPEEG